MERRDFWRRRGARERNVVLLEERLGFEGPCKGGATISESTYFTMFVPGTGTALSRLDELFGPRTVSD